MLQPELRFFLALLLNVPDRPRLLSLVEQAFPGRGAIDTVVGWLAELSRLDAIHAWASSVASGPVDARAPGVLGTSLDERATRIVRHLLEGLTDQAVVECLKAEGVARDVDAGKVLQVCEALRGAPLLRPLFARDPDELRR